LAKSIKTGSKNTLLANVHKKTPPKHQKRKMSGGYLTILREKFVKIAQKTKRDFRLFLLLFQ
jgi:hypothetical protein